MLHRQGISDVLRMVTDRELSVRMRGLLRLLSIRVIGWLGRARPHPQGEAVAAPSAEALARLTGGVAHDFNNLLTVVLGNAAALRVSAEARGDAQGMRRAEQIERAAERGSRLAAQLLAFSGKLVLEPRVVSVYSVISESHHLLADAAGDAVRILLHPDRNLWRSRVDPIQLESAILNLVLNARDALANGGEIRIEFHNRRVALDAKAPWRAAGDFVSISVADDGTGIPPELLQRVFEPFFTTKPIGKASGLGLAQVQGFARQSGGWTEIVSAVGQGTTVSVFLPRFRADRTEGSRPEAAVVKATTILLVDPDAEDHEHSKRALIEAGYTVLDASTSSSAITHLVSNAEIALLLTAAQLPGGISGANLGRHARTLRPALRVLVSSSKLRDAPPESVRRSSSARYFEFLLKPHRPADLIAVVAALLAIDNVSVETDEMLADARDIAWRQAPEAAMGPAPGPAIGHAPSPATGPNVPANDTTTIPVRVEQAVARINAVRLGVLPFTSIGTDNHAFCTGLAEEISAAVAGFRMITCVASASVAAVAGELRERTERWQQLELDYVVDGSLRRTGENVRLLVRLLKMGGAGEIAWSQRFECDIADVLNLQDRIARDIAAQVGPEIVAWETREAARRPRVDPAAHDMMLRAIPAIYSLDEAGFAEAGRLLETALVLDPSSAACHSWLAHWYMLKVGQGWETDQQHGIDRADHLSQSAIKLDPEDARGLTIAGHVRSFLRRDAEGGLALHERALALNPSLALAWCYAGLAHSYRGNHAEAIRSIEHARHLSPHDPHAFFFDMSLIVPFLMTGEYETAAMLGRRARDVHPGVSSTYKGLVAALGLLGASLEAAEAREALLRLEPRFCITSAIARSPLLQAQDLDRYIEGLRKAGVPEQWEGPRRPSSVGDTRRVGGLA
jgi:signal transduction histidine kinase/TolB-like protein/FixJ family two-component response regulator